MTDSSAGQPSNLVTEVDLYQATQWKTKTTAPSFRKEIPMSNFARCAAITAVLTAAIVMVAPSAQAQAQEQSQPEKKTSIWSRFKQEVKAAVAPAGSAGSSFPGAHRRIQETPLNDLFNGPAAGEDYPHVAITITDWSDRITSRGMNPFSKAQGNDCMVFDAVLWRNAKSSERFDNLIICADQSHRGFMRGAMDGFRFGSALNHHTGQRRTTGPLPPANVYPGTPEADRLLDGPGQLLLANLLMEMGLDLSYAGNLGRVWVVSVNNESGT